MKTRIVTTAVLFVVMFILAGCSINCSSKKSVKVVSNSTETTNSAHVETSTPRKSKSKERTKPKNISASPSWPTKGSTLTSASQLTDETTGKGKISMGDTLAQVKAVLKDYRLINSKVTYYPPSNGGPSQYWAGTTAYLFNEKGKLAGVMSATGAEFKFETSRGLKLGDTVAKMKSIYGNDYIYEAGVPEEGQLPRYTYEFPSGWGIMLQLDPNGKGDSAKIWEIDF